jgi:hypothetical protein
MRTAALAAYLNKAMHGESPTARFQMEDCSRRPGDRHRYLLNENMLNPYAAPLNAATPNTTVSQYSPWFVLARGTAIGLAITGTLCGTSFCWTNIAPVTAIFVTLLGGSVVLCGAALMVILNVAARMQIAGHAGRNSTMTAVTLLIGSVMLSFGVCNHLAEERHSKRRAETFRRLTEEIESYAARVREMSSNSSTTSREQTKGK